MFASTLPNRRPNSTRLSLGSNGRSNSASSNAPTQPGLNSAAASSTEQRVVGAYSNRAVAPGPTPSTTFNNLDYASQQKIMRAINILGNHGLLMKYALENDVSIPQARHYFEQVVGGGNPEPIITKWFPL